jgi:hypothetical protein
VEYPVYSVAYIVIIFIPVLGVEVTGGTLDETGVRQDLNQISAGKNNTSVNHIGGVIIRLFRNFVIFVRQITWFRWNSWHWTSSVNVHNKNSQSICAVLTFDPQLKKILIFSVKDRYQLKYFICIKDFNAETSTSLKLNLFSFFICGCRHHQRKMICLYVYISDIRQIVGYRTPVFIQRFPWHLHITITYNLLHLWLWYADVVTVIA